MIGPPTNTRVWIAAGVTDLRRGFTGLSALVESKLEQKPFSGHVFVFRGRRGDLIKVLWYDGDGLCNPSAENPQNRLRVQASLLSVAPLVRSQCFDTRRWWRARRCGVLLQTS
jgi:transposase